MLPLSDLKAALENVQVSQIEGKLHRLSSLEAWEAGDPRRLLYDEGPEKSTKGWRFSPPAPDGHRGLYCGVDRATAGSEFARGRDRWDQGDCIDHVGFRIFVKLKAVLDLGKPKILRDLGMSADEVAMKWLGHHEIHGEWPVTWLLGKAVYDSARFDGILYPSTMNPPDGRCLLVFTERLDGSASWMEILKLDGSLRERIPALV